MNHLFYYTVGYSDKYVDCLKLSIASLRKYNKNSDIIVLVDESLAEKAQAVISDVKFILCPDSKTPEEASMRKLKIFDYDIQKYSTVLFIDSDIIIHTNINTIVSSIVSYNKVYVFSEKSYMYPEFKDRNVNFHTESYWSLNNYSQSDLDYLSNTNTEVFNAGLFAFKPTTGMKNHFIAMNNMIQAHNGPFFYEQSFMNVYFNLNGMTDRTLFTDDNYILFPNEDTNYNGKIIHFCGAVADGYTKYNKMNSYINKYMNTDSITIYNTRLEMIHALIHKNSVIAEIGIFKGTFARELYDLLLPTEFYLIDLFSGYTCSGNEHGNNVVYTDMDNEYRQMISYSQGKRGLVILKGDSSTMLSRLPDNTFDMIYIDGDHSYEGCKKDLLEAYKKVKNGGYICGHDYEMNMSKANTMYQFGVKQAVDEFCLNFNQTIVAKGNDGCVSYAIQLKK